MQKKQDMLLSNNSKTDPNLGVHFFKFSELADKRIAANTIAHDFVWQQCSKNFAINCGCDKTRKIQNCDQICNGMEPKTHTSKSANQELQQGASVGKNTNGCLH